MIRPANVGPIPGRVSISSTEAWLMLIAWFEFAWTGAVAGGEGMFGGWRDTQDVRKATIRKGRISFEISAAAEPF